MPLYRLVDNPSPEELADGGEHPDRRDEALIDHAFPTAHGYPFGRP